MATTSSLHLFQYVPDAHGLGDKVRALHSVRHQNTRQFSGILRTNGRITQIKVQRVTRLTAVIITAPWYCSS